MPDTIDRATTALLVIDLQRDFLEADGYAARAGLDIAPLQAVVPNVARLLAAARAAGLVVVHTREANAPDLSDVPPAFVDASRRTGAAVGSDGPLGRLLIRGEPGSAIAAAVAPVPGEIAIDKPGFSAFEGTALGAMLTARGIRTLILCGVTTEVCVTSTLRTAIDRGYRCITVDDACASGNASLHAAALSMIDVEGGVFGRRATTDAVCAALAAG
ncbi:MAG: cysteine hydrolase [Burkholderiales bacterium]|jgi:nicotinamidase-related amidase|nr:cysteine hydrolase [Burkholderiales bacterium]